MASRSSARTGGRRSLAVIAFIIGFAAVLGVVTPRAFWSRSFPDLFPVPPAPTGTITPPRATGTAAARLGPATLVRVVDGDTLLVRIAGREERVRLLNVNTPERGLPGHMAATRALERLIARRPLRLEAGATSSTAKRDRYQRLLAFVFAGDELVNVELVRQGWSPFYTRFGRGRYAERFAAAEAEARAARVGLYRPGFAER